MVVSKITMTVNILKHKFRGCLVGCLLGDCLGAPFEGDALSAGAKLVVQNYFNKLDGPYFQGSITQFIYSTIFNCSFI